VKTGDMVRRYPVLTYFGLAFTISWVGCLLAAGPKFIRGETMEAVDGLLVFLAMLLGPSLAGVALTAFLDGTRGLRDLRSRMTRARFGLPWYLAPLVFPLLIALAIFALRILASKEFTLTFALLGIPIGLMAGFFEEIGWTGYALPRMLGKRSVLVVAISLGLLQTMWHLAADFLTASGTRGAYWLPHFAVFIVSMTAMRVFVVWAYVNTKSVLLAQLMHASSTGFLAVLVPLSLSPAQDTLFYAVYSVVLWGAVAVVVALFGKNLVRPHAG
jgi:membrane protease YdiL (CAAX protease family)